MNNDALPDVFILVTSHGHPVLLSGLLHCGPRDNPRFGRWTNVEMDTNHSPKRRMRVVNSGEWMVNNG